MQFSYGINAELPCAAESQESAVCDAWGVYANALLVAHGLQPSDGPEYVDFNQDEQACIVRLWVPGAVLTEAQAKLIFGAVGCQMCIVNVEGATPSQLAMLHHVCKSLGVDGTDPQYLEGDGCACLYVHNAQQLSELSNCL